jgi:hypothetical protein
MLWDGRINEAGIAVCTNAPCATTALLRAGSISLQMSQASMHRRRAVHVGSLALHGSSIVASALMQLVCVARRAMYPEAHGPLGSPRTRASNGASGRPERRDASSPGAGGMRGAMSTEALQWLRVVVPGINSAGYQIQSPPHGRTISHGRTTDSCWVWTAAGPCGGVAASAAVFWSCCRS